MIIQIIGLLYVLVAATSLLSTLLLMVDCPIEGIDNVWDWFWYSILWIKPCIKSLYKIIIL